MWSGVELKTKRQTSYFYFYNTAAVFVFTLLHTSVYEPSKNIVLRCKALNAFHGVLLRFVEHYHRRSTRQYPSFPRLSVCLSVSGVLWRTEII